MDFVILILVIVSNTDQIEEIDEVDNEYQVEVVRYDHDQDSTFQEPTSDIQNESTDPGKDLFCILFIFLA